MSQIAHSNSNASSSQLTSTIRKSPAAPAAAGADFAELLLGKTSRPRRTAATPDRRSVATGTTKAPPAADRSDTPVDEELGRLDESTRPDRDSVGRPVSRSGPANTADDADRAVEPAGDSSLDEPDSQLTWVATLLSSLPDETAAPILDEPIATASATLLPVDGALVAASATPFDTVLEVPDAPASSPAAADDSELVLPAETVLPETWSSGEPAGDASDATATAPSQRLDQIVADVHRAEPNAEPIVDELQSAVLPQDGGFPETGLPRDAERAVPITPAEMHGESESDFGDSGGEELPASQSSDKPGASGAVNNRADFESSLRPAANVTGPSSGLTEAQQERLVDRVRRAFLAARQRGGPLRIRLHPPELGSLKLELQVQRGGVRASLETDTAAAKSVLVEHLAALKERLAESGLRIDTFDVRWRDPAEARQDSGQNGTFGQNRGTRHAPRSGDSGDKRGGMEAVAETALRGVPGDLPGRLNVRV